MIIVNCGGDHHHHNDLHSHQRQIIGEMQIGKELQSQLHFDVVVLKLHGTNRRRCRGNHYNCDDSLQLIDHGYFA